jgi:predicted RNA-binding protein with PUA-like domain
MVRSPGHWLVKSEPDCFSIDDLAAAPEQTTCWSGVRNYQARNFMRDGMKLGDPVLFYHSSADPTAIVGLAEVARESYADSTAWDPDDDHYDPKASRLNPIWQMVDIRLVEIFPRPLELSELRSIAALGRMELLRQGSRLSVQPVEKGEFAAIMELAHASKVPATSKPKGAKPGKKTKAKAVAKVVAKTAKLKGAKSAAPSTGSKTAKRASSGR